MDRKHSGLSSRIASVGEWPAYAQAVPGRVTDHVGGGTKRSGLLSPARGNFKGPFIQSSGYL